MGVYIAKRLLLMIPTFFGITVITFAVMRLAPGDPLMLDTEGGQGPSAATIEAIRESRGMNRPLAVQYAVWVGRVLTLDFGDSTQDQRPVIEKIGEGLPRTLFLSTFALLIAYLLAIPLGTLSAVKQGTWIDRVATFGVFVLYSLPLPWTAIMLLVGLSSRRGLNVFPLQGLASDDFAQLGTIAKIGDLAWHAVLPVACLSYVGLAQISRYMRAGMLEVVRQDYIRTARAKGLAERAVVFRHAFRNSLIPIVTLLGLMLPYLIGGSVVVERIFGIPGMGLLAFEAILHRDYAMVMGITTLAALLTMVSMLLSDLLYAAVDPRISFGESR